MIKISIIIPVFNEAKILEKSLENLGTDGDIEVIVVDGGSTDKTVRLAQKSPVKVVVSPHPGRACQMN
jgi:glycosyltransferase involved in cell wall biosynthesis